MMRVKVGLLAFLLQWALLGGVRASDADLAGIEPLMDTLVAQQMAEFQVPNLTLAVVSGGEVALMKGYGYADLGANLAVDPEKTLFRIGSTAKLFTWTAVMQLVEAGVLELDVDVNRYLDFAIPSSLAVGSRGAEVAPITLEHLMTHRAGFEDRTTGMFGLREDRITPLEEHVRTRLPARIFPPGEVAAYSNYGVALAGYIVQRASGIPFAQYVEERIFKPLGMHHSTFRQPLPTHLAGQLTKAYRYVEGEFREAAFEYMNEPTGSMSTTAQDVARFMLAYLQGGALDGQRILEEETTSQMFDLLVSDHPFLAGIAHGFMEGHFNGRRVLFHPGGTMLFDTALYLLPQEQVGFFISHSGGSYLVNVHLFQAFMDQYFPASHEEVDVRAVKPADLQRFAGEYHINRRALTTSEKFLSLIMPQIRVGVDQDGYLLVTHLGATSRFAELEPNVFFNLSDERVSDYSGDFRFVVFGTDPFGKTLLMTGGPMSYSRAAWYETTALTFVTLALAALFIVLSLVVWTVLVVIRLFTRAKSSPAPPWAAKLAAWTARGYAVLTLFFVLGFVLESGADPVYALPASAYGETSALSAFFDTVPLLMSVVGLAVVIFAVLAWVKSYWSRYRRIHYALFAVSTLCLSWVFYYWNALL